ncbi:hypothetical protein DBR32_01865 [Taibaiella sp. KBW10]|uniref:M4 family metallopeptidase n=1 Tax=Taibaiella sp. KBW10 TaxID=2153357 RepID=UPI000F5A23A0|nr:M4 family metallopeptidase [Taibaiella sp. KBW10]RQO32375.1 hypothetical protein DBR32_01865 [Taibaiella sp. KBW10]
MKYPKFTSLLLLSGMLSGTGMTVFAQQNNNPTALTAIPLENGKVMVSFRGKNVIAKDIDKNLVRLLDLPNGHSFSLEKTSTDRLGYTHYAYQQFYKNVKVEGATLLVHTKGNTIESINGRVASITDLSTTAGIDKVQAVTAAQNSLSIKSLLNTYPANLTIVSLNPKGNNDFALAYLVRIDGKTTEGKVVMKNVFVDAASGTVLKAVNLIAHQDVNATAHTFLSGIQTIVTDSVGPHYRLRDNARNIETMDASGADMDQSFGNPNIFPLAKEYHDLSTEWTEKPALMSIRLSAVSSNSNFLNGLGWGTTAFPTATVLGSSTAVPEAMASWPDIKFNALTLPIVTRNLFVFPESGTTYTGTFAKLNLSTGFASDTILFPINITGVGTFPWSDTANNAGNYVVTKTKNPALDAHWGIEQTYDYYKTVFNRTSYDDNGGKIMNYVNGVWPSAFTQNNAAAMPDPYNAMVYGMGDGATYNPFVALDVTGHEFSHMVVGHNGNGGLAYTGESGALNESFADIFGTCVEFYAKPTVANWTIGEEVFIGTNFLRSMANPKLRQNPHTYGGQYWIDPTNGNNDNGGVHTNSGIQNKWFYLLCQGGSGTNDNGKTYNVTAIGMEKAEKIAYRNLMQYLTSNADYLDAYTGSLQATLDLYGNDTNSVEYKMVKHAWYAVGIGGDNAVGISSVDKGNKNINVYPNPASSNVNISSTLNKVIDMQLLNALGQNVRTLKVKSGNNAYDISGLPKGVYTLSFIVDGQSYIHKVSVL